MRVTTEIRLREAGELPGSLLIKGHILPGSSITTLTTGTWLTSGRYTLPLVISSKFQPNYQVPVVPLLLYHTTRYLWYHYSCTTQPTPKTPQAIHGYELQRLHACASTVPGNHRRSLDADNVSRSMSKHHHHVQLGIPLRHCRSLVLTTTAARNRLPRPCCF